MKKHIILPIFIVIMLVLSKIAIASNPVDLLLLNPPPPDSVQVTIDLGMNTCESMECEYFTVYITGSGSPQYLVYNFSWVGTGSWSTYTIPYTAVSEPNPKQICVFWYFSGTCHPQLNNKTCCVTYTGSGTYPIPCNPCN